MSAPTDTVRAVIFDVDDVVTEMDGVIVAAERAVIAPIAAAHGQPAAERVSASLTASYATLRAQLRAGPGEVAPGYLALRARIEGWQRGVTEAGFEVKQWSRDTLLAIAMEDQGLSFAAQTLVAAAAAYWRTVAEQSRLYDDAARAFALLSRRGIPFQLATNSDGFLRYDHPARTFRYDPPYAVAKKLERMRALAAHGIEPQAVTIGDPIGKPSPAFYQRVLADLSARVGPVSPDALLAIGDSAVNDVLPLLELGAIRGGVLDRHGGPERPEPSPIHPRAFTIGSLDAVAALLEG
jgi:FMN phosphatase YigB (HAD superfamily)